MQAISLLAYNSFLLEQQKKVEEKIILIFLLLLHIHYCAKKYIRYDKKIHLRTDNHLIVNQ